MEEFFKKLTAKSIWIVVILAILLVIKSCQSCNRNQQIEFANYNNIIITDSLNNEITKRDSIIYLYIDSINVLRAEKKAGQYMIENLQQDKESYRKTINQLTKKVNNQ